LGKRPELRRSRPSIESNPVLDLGGAWPLQSPDPGRYRLPRLHPSRRAQDAARKRRKRASADAASARACSSSSSFQEELKKGGGDTRARPIDENVSAEQIADTVEQLVKETGHWPKGGWLRSATVEQIDRRLRIGQIPSLIVDAVTLACKRDTSGQPFRCFGYFDAPITRAHSEANKEPMLPLDGTGGQHGRTRSNDSARCDAQREAQQFASQYIEQCRTNIPGRG